VNLGANETSLDPSESAGVAAQTNWNNASGGQGDLIGLMDDSGAVTGANIHWSPLDDSGNENAWGGATWNMSGRGTGGNDSLMDGYVDPVWGDWKAMVMLTDIPYAQYDAYVYFGTDNTGSLGYATDGTTTYTYADEYSDPFGGFIQTTATDGSTPVANYAKFSGLTGDVTLMTGTLSGSDGCGAGMLGVQIVEVPEPMTLSLLGLGGLALIRRRRA